MSIPEGGLYNNEVRDGGEIAEHLPDEYVQSFAAEGEILFGSAVVRGSEDAGVKTISAATDEFLGVAAKSFEASQFDDELYSIGDPVGVIRKGIVVVYAEEAVDPGDPVRVRHTAVTGKAAGAFCTTAEAGKTAVISNAEYRGTITGAGYVALWVSGPFKLTADV